MDKPRDFNVPELISGLKLPHYVKAEQGGRLGQPVRHRGTRAELTVVLPSNIHLLGKLLAAEELLERPVRIQVPEAWPCDDLIVRLVGHVVVIVRVCEHKQLINSRGGSWLPNNSRGPEWHVLDLQTGNAVLIPRLVNLPETCSLVKLDVLTVSWVLPTIQILPRNDNINLRGISTQNFDWHKRNTSLAAVVQARYGCGLLLG